MRRFLYIAAAVCCVVAGVVTFCSIGRHRPIDLHCPVTQCGVTGDVALAEARCLAHRANATGDGWTANATGRIPARLDHRSNATAERSTLPFSGEDVPFGGMDVGVDSGDRDNIPPLLYNVDGIAPLLVSELGQTLDEDKRQRIIDILKAMGHERLPAVLADAVRSPTDDVHAGDCIGIMLLASSPKQVSAYVDLLKGADGEVATVAAYALASIGSSQASEVLAETAMNSEDKELAAVSADALSQIDSIYAQESLISVLCDRSVSDGVRLAAFTALDSGAFTQRLRTILVNLARDPESAALHEVIELALDADQQMASLNTGSEINLDSSVEELCTNMSEYKLN